MLSRQPTETEINGHRYQLGVLDIEASWEVGKRIMDGLTILAREMPTTQETPTPADDEAEVNTASTFDPGSPEMKSAMMVYVRQILVKLSDADSKRVMGICLRACKRWDERAGGGTWRPILASGGGLLFRDGDVTLGEMLELVIAVIDLNLSDFLFGASTVPQ